MLASVKPTSGPAAQTMALIEVVISSPHIMCLFTLSKTSSMGVSSGVLLWKMWSTLQWIYTTGHVCGWPVRPCLIDPHLKLFFWVVKNRTTKLAWAKSGVGAVPELCAWDPMENCVSHKGKWLGGGGVSVFPLQYSPVRRRKNKLIQ